MPAPPQGPKALFEQKKDWIRSEFLGRVAKAPFGLESYHERRKMIDQALPSSRFSTYISEHEVKNRLRELRKQETFAKNYTEKQKTARLRRYLEEATGLKGKY